MKRKSPRRQGFSTVILGESRGKLLGELCGEALTAVELAGRVGTSSNAVRVHLDALRAAGLVAYEVQRRGVGKPTYVFHLTPLAEYLLSRAYAPALEALLAALRRTLGSGVTPILRAAGASLATSDRGDQPDAMSITSGLRLFQDLGATAQLKTGAGHATIESACCPLGALSRNHAEPCLMIEGMLATATGLHVRQHCNRGQHPRCVFELSPRRERRRS